MDSLIDNFDSIVQRGQVRHLPGKEVWQRMVIDRHPEGSYQNGAFWATPLPWVVPVVARRSSELARRMIADTLQDFRANGVAECINGLERKVPNFVVSITNLYGAYRSLSEVNAAH